jgi:ribonuclease P protein component
VYRDGRFFHSPLVTLHCLRREDPEEPRIGFVAGKRLGTIAGRNRWKRRVRAAVGARLGEISNGVDLVFVLRPGILRADSAGILAAVDNLLRMAGVLTQ